MKCNWLCQKLGMLKVFEVKRTGFICGWEVVRVHCPESLLGYAIYIFIYFLSKGYAILPDFFLTGPHTFDSKICVFEHSFFRMHLILHATEYILLQGIDFVRIGRPEVVHEEVREHCFPGLIDPSHKSICLKSLLMFVIICRYLTRRKGNAKC